MSAWGAAAAAAGGGATSCATRSIHNNNCDSLLERIERNDSSLQDLILLPMKNMDTASWHRLIHALYRHGQDRCLTSIQASGHEISNIETLTCLGRAIHVTSQHVPWKCIALGKSDMGDAGVVALCTGLLGSASSTSNTSNGSSSNSSSAPLLRLEALDLSFKEMKTGAGFVSIIRLCQDCTFLKHLNLSRNPGICGDNDETGGGECSSFMVNNNESINSSIFPHVENLDLSSCNITGNDHVNHHANLLTSLSMSKNLCILRLSSNPLGGSTSATAAAAAAMVAALGLILQRLPLLRELHLSNCQINDDAMQALPWTTTSEQTSCGCSLLQVLDLSMNQISAKGGIQALALGLASSMKSLVDLNLAGNPLLFEGVESLVCNGLVKRQLQQQQSSSLSSLLSLDLSETKCTGQGAALAIAQSGVKSLRLYNNDLQSNHGFQTIAPCLVGGHATMECLDLSGNGADEASLVHLLRGLLLLEQGIDSSTTTTDESSSSSSKLQTLIVGGNQGGDSVEEMVCQILKIRPGLDIARDKRGSRMQS